MDETPKAIKRSISFPPELFRVAQATADKSYGGNLSAFIQDLISGRGVSPFSESEILVTLCEKFQPTLAAKLAQGLAGKQQARILARLLEATAAALDTEMDLYATIELADKARMEAWEKIGEDRMSSIATQIADLLDKKEPERLLQAVAEEVAPYIAEEQKAKSDAKLAQEAIRSSKTKNSKSRSKAS